MVDFIRALCAENGMTIAQLERDLGLSKASIAKWDDSRPSVDKVQKVAAYFGMTVSDLLGETKTPATADGDGLSDEDMEIVELLMQISPEDKQTVLALLRSLSAQHEAPPSAAR